LRPADRSIFAWIKKSTPNPAQMATQMALAIRTGIIGEGSSGEDRAGGDERPERIDEGTVGKAAAASRGDPLRMPEIDDPARSEPLLHVVLDRPEIPNNTGNIGRTALATGCRLHLIHPLGFELSEKACRRAGLDYWPSLDWCEHRSFEAYAATRPQRLWLFTSKATRAHWDADFQPGDHLLFGRETAGCDESVHAWVDAAFGDGHRLRLPMVPRPEARSLNLATAVAVGIYEALRQLHRTGPPRRETFPR
jgi:tRNA (cytidine/uridine-2'-O-)-methyltransferase